MADSVPLLEAAIYARLGTVQYSYFAGTVPVSGSVSVVNTLAPQQTAPPYIVFQQQAGLDDYKFGDYSDESFDYVAKVVSLKAYPTMEAQPIYSGVHTALQDAPLSVSGQQVLRVRRMSRIKYRDTGGYWHVGGLYRLDIHKT